MLLLAARRRSWAFYKRKKNLPAWISYLCSWCRGRQGNVALFCKWKRVDRCFQIVDRSANCTLLLVAGRRSWAFYTRKKTTCLHFLPLFMAQRATGQRRPLLQVETGRSMLPDRRQKRKLHVTSCSWKTKLGIYTRKKNYLLALFIFVRGVEGDEATSPSFTAGNEAIDASSSSLEALIATL